MKRDTALAKLRSFERRLREREISALYLAVFADPRWQGKPDRALFYVGFAKNERANIEDGELQSLKENAGELLARNDSALDEAVI